MGEEATPAHTHPVPEPGCYAPAVTLFDPDTDRLDLEAQAKYFAYLASTGLKGLVVLGTNAETLLLTREERRALLETARASVPPGFPIIAGVSGHSTAQVLEYAADARAAGANFLLILPCAYFGKQTTGRVVEDFFDQVATAVAPAPIVLYNFPAVCSGVDMDADTIIRITERNPNVVGVKLTCANVSKVVRLSAKFPPRRFAAFGGQSDFLVGTLASGGAGCIAAFGNVFPRSIARLFDLWQAGKHAEALRLQQDLALAESAIKAGVAGTKWAAAVYTAPRAGIVPAERARRLFQPRRPYGELGAEGRARVEAVMGPISAYEDFKE